MKTNNSSNRSVQGNALLLTIVATGIVGFLLAAYAGLVQSQNNAVARSQSWNATIPVVEAGVEDALSHLNRHGDDTTLVGQGWTALGGTRYGVKRFIGNNYYTVTISNWIAGATNVTPVVESRGYVAAPSIIAGVPQSTPMLAAVGVTPQRGSSYLARGIRVTTRRPALFSKGMVAKGNINMNNHNIYADSFDSEDPAKSTGGKWDITKRGDKGSVASNDGVVNIGAADVFGNVYTGPSGSFSITSGSVGDKAWVEASRPGIQPGHYFNDMNMEFPDAKVPFTGGFTPSPGPGGDYVLGTDDYYISTMSMSGNKKMLVTGHARLHVVSGFSMSGNAYIEIAPGASLKMYVGGLADLSGKGVVNKTGNAANFFYYGLPSNTSVALKGNGTFFGVIYAPNAAMTMSGGGTGAEDFSGASITKSVTMNGHFKFHFDEALARMGIGKGFVVTSWNEMDPREVAAGPTL